MAKAKQKSSPSPGWVGLTLIIWLLGAGFSFWWTYNAVEAGENPAEDAIARLATTAVIGVLIGGVGLLVQTVGHESESKCWVTTRKGAVLVGLFGWSIGVPAAVFLAVKGTDASEWVIRVSVLVMVGIPMITLLVMGIVAVIRKK